MTVLVWNEELEAWERLHKILVIRPCIGAGRTYTAWRYC